MNKTNKKGFTLAELLIVVAIIAVLVAIAIPVFTAQLEKSREAVDAANIRAKYAELMADAITDGETEITKTVKLTQTKAEWQNTFDLPENLVSAAGAAQPTGTAGQEVTLTYKPDSSNIEINLLLK